MPGGNDAFVDRVLAIEPRLAAFDCDGTLWTIDCGFGFFEWELGQGIVTAEVAAWARGRYDAYLAGAVDEDTICGADHPLVARGDEPDLCVALEQPREEP